MPLLIALFGAVMAALGLFDGEGAGGEGGNGGAAPVAGGAPPNDSARNAAGAGERAPAAGGEGEGADGDGQDPKQDGTKLTDPTELQTALNRANAQAAAARTRATTAETDKKQALDAFKPIARLLGLDTGEEPDPAQLQAKLEQTQAALRAERINNAFYRVASQEGANPELTLRYLRGGNELDDLDPEKSEFAATLKTIVQAAISSTPALKASPQAGGSFDGGARGGDTPAEPDDLAGLIAHRVSQQRRSPQA